MEQHGEQMAKDTLPIALKQPKPLLLPRKFPSVKNIFSAGDLWKACRERGVYTKDMGWTATAAKYRRRLVQHDRGTLQYEHMATERLHGIASSRLIEPGIDTREYEIERTKLIALLRKDDDVKRPKPFNFLGLAPELRNTIYELLLVDSDHILMLPEMPSLLHVNQQIRKEASAVFFGFNNFFLPAYAISESKPSNEWKRLKFTSNSTITCGNVHEWIDMIDYSLFSTRLSLTIHSPSMNNGRYIIEKEHNLFDIELNCLDKT